jgi:hypothetical protein
MEKSRLEQFFVSHKKTPRSKVIALSPSEKRASYDIAATAPSLLKDL